jgi:hypothetical protein
MKPGLRLHQVFCLRLSGAPLTTLPNGAIPCRSFGDLTNSHPNVKSVIRLERQRRCRPAESRRGSAWIIALVFVLTQVLVLTQVFVSSDVTWSCR